MSETWVRESNRAPLDLGAEEDVSMCPQTRQTTEQRKSADSVTARRLTVLSFEFNLVYIALGPRYPLLATSGDNNNNLPAHNPTT